MVTFQWKKGDRYHLNQVIKVKIKNNTHQYNTRKGHYRPRSVDFELIKREIPPGGPNLTRWADAAEVTVLWTLGEQTAMFWTGLCGRECQQPLGDEGLSLTITEHEFCQPQEDSKIQMRMHSRQHLDFSPLRPSRQPSCTTFGFLIYRNCEVINGRCFKPLNLW